LSLFIAKKLIAESVVGRIRHKKLSSFSSVTKTSEPSSQTSWKKIRRTKYRKPMEKNNQFLNGE